MNLTKEHLIEVTNLKPHEIDEILKNQKMCVYYQKFDTEHDMLKVLEKAKKWDEHDKEYCRDKGIYTRLNARIKLLDKICKEDFTEGITHQDLEDEIEELIKLRDDS